MSDAASRIPNALDESFGRGRPALICYLPLGDPALQHADPAEYLAEGVDVLEIGVPAADSKLDGPVIAESMRRARENGMDNAIAAGAIAELRGRFDAAAMVWMTYPTAAAEPGWADAVAASGVDGTLVAGAGPGQYRPPPGVRQIVFVPHSPTTRDLTAAAEATGYVMAAAANGVTGNRLGISPGNGALLERIRTSGVTVPLVLGFGISDRASVHRAVECGAQGVVVGSAVVSAAAQGRDVLVRLLRELRAALDG
ncbi:MAG: tryptophan synthase subunit alpha [Jatrophihabitans sp.]